MKVSLVIPTYNKKARLALVLQSVSRLKYDKELEVIIVNDGSDDGTKNVVEDFCREIRESDRIRIKLLDTPNNGRSKARNAGIAKADGELIIFADDDLILSETFVEGHVKEHLRSDRAVVHGRIYSLPQLKFMRDPATGEQYDGTMSSKKMGQYCITPGMFNDGRILQYLQANSRISKFEKDIWELFQHTSPADSYVRWIGFTGGNVSIRKKNIGTCELFDPEMGMVWGCEDIEVGYRLSLKGMQFLYAPEASNYHMNHFRKSADSEHHTSLTYFYNKYRNRMIKQLGVYFDKGFHTLMEWKKSLDE